MDRTRFDSLTRALATGKSRRDVLKILAGGTIGGALAFTAIDDAAAECHGIPCSSDGDCCAGSPFCSGGVCATQMAAPAPAAPADDTADDTTAAAGTLPATGAGPASSSSGAWLVAAAAGGAALFASKVMRRDRADAEETL